MNVALLINIIHRAGLQQRLPRTLSASVPVLSSATTHDSSLSLLRFICASFCVFLIPRNPAFPSCKSRIRSPLLCLSHGFQRTCSTSLYSSLLSSSLPSHTLLFFIVNKQWLLSYFNQKHHAGTPNSPASPAPTDTSSFLWASLPPSPPPRGLQRFLCGVVFVETRQRGRQNIRVICR